jgi:hypothetical protein
MGYDMTVEGFPREIGVRFKLFVWDAQFNLTSFYSPTESTYSRSISPSQLLNILLSMPRISIPLDIFSIEVSLMQSYEVRSVTAVLKTDETR